MQVYQLRVCDTSGNTDIGELMSAPSMLFSTFNAAAQRAQQEMQWLCKEAEEPAPILQWTHKPDDEFSQWSCENPGDYDWSFFIYCSTVV